MPSLLISLVQKPLGLKLWFPRQRDASPRNTILEIDTGVEILQIYAGAARALRPGDLALTEENDTHPPDGFILEMRGVLISPKSPLPIYVHELSEVTSLKALTEAEKKSRSDKDEIDASPFYHENLVPIIAYGEFFIDKGRSYAEPLLVYPRELRESWNLHGYIERFGADLSVVKKLEILIQIGEGLRYLYQRVPSVVHGAINPWNIIITTRHKPEVRIKGCGLRRISKKLPGAAAYEPMGGEEPSTDFDLYCFASLMVLLMSGVEPDPEDFVVVNVDGQTTKEPKSKERYTSTSMSDPLWALVRRCWREEPKARSTILEVLEALNRYLEEASGQSRKTPDPGLEAANRLALARPPWDQ